MKRQVFIKYSASEVLGMAFVRWQRRRFPKDWRGHREKGWWGVGAVVFSSWIWNHPGGWWASRRQRLPRNHEWLAPHTDLFLTPGGCRTGRGRRLKRPTMKEYQRLVLRRKGEPNERT